MLLVPPLHTKLIVEYKTMEMSRFFPALLTLIVIACSFGVQGQYPAEQVGDSSPSYYSTNPSSTSSSQTEQIEQPSPSSYSTNPSGMPSQTEQTDQSAPSYYSAIPSSTAVALTVYVHEGDLNGTMLSDVHVTGQDAAGNDFQGVTDSDGVVVISGEPGTWQFSFTKDGYDPLDLSYDVTETGEGAVYLTRSNVTEMDEGADYLAE